MMKLYIFFIFFIAFVSLAKAQLSANFKADTTLVCEGITVNFTDLSTSDTTITAWLWDFGDGNTSNLQNPDNVYSSAGTYTVKLTVQDENSNVNAKIITEYITVRKQPEASFVYNLANDIFLTDTFSLSSFIYEFRSNSVLYDSLDYIYSWDFGNGTFVDSSSSLIYKFETEGNYTIRFVISAGLSCTDTAETEITIEDVTSLPNVFTPNGDGINDFMIIKTNGVQNYNLIIFNRWGTIVHTINAKKITWDGYTSAGVLVDPGVYYYHLSCQENGYNKTGFIHVIR